MNKIFLITSVALFLLINGVNAQNSGDDLPDGLKNKITEEADSVMNYFFDPDHLNYKDQVVHLCPCQRCSHMYD
jgi:hypothetical protein